MGNLVERRPHKSAYLWIDLRTSCAFRLLRTRDRGYRVAAYDVYTEQLIMMMEVDEYHSRYPEGPMLIWHTGPEDLGKYMKYLERHGKLDHGF